MVTSRPVIFRGFSHIRLHAAIMETRNRLQGQRQQYAAAVAGQPQQPGVPVAPAPAAVAPARLDIKLPTYWDHNPDGWFSFIEARFRVAGLFDEVNRFDIAAANLTEAAIDLTLDLLKNRPVARPYGVLKERLLHEHQLTPFQRARALQAAPAMGDRTPS